MRHRPARWLIPSVLALAVALVLVIAGSVWAASSPTRSASAVSAGPVGFKQKQATTNRLNVRWRPGISATRVDAAAKELGFKVVRKSGRLGWTQLEPAKAMKASALASSLRTKHLVREASPARWYRSTETTANDPLFPEQWGLSNTGQFGGTAGDDIKATTAWSTSTGSKNVIVAVVDEGANWAHPDLKDNMWLNTAEIPANGIDDDHDGYVDDVRGYDFYNGDGSVFDPSDGDRHGTHVAGIIGAKGNNSTGGVGVNWNVTIMPVKFLGPYGGDDFAGAEAIEYAVDHGATVINCSWGGSGGSEILDEAIAYAAAHNVLIVCAAGNESANADEEIFYPASSPATNVVSVAASDRDDQMAWFSNYGKESVDLAAPGVDVTSTLPAEPSAQFIDSSPYKICYVPVQAEVLEPTSARDSIITKSVARLGEATTTPILVIDDSSAAITEETQGVRLGIYTDALTAAGYTHVTTWVTDAQGTPTPEAMRGKIVLWFTGKMSSSLYSDMCVNGEEQTALSQYLDNGGRLVMISGEMAYDIASGGFWSEQLTDSDFLLDYFHVTVSDAAAWCSQFVGKSGTPFAGITAVLPEEYANGDGYPTGSDSIYPIGDGATETQMSTGQYGPLSGTSMAAPHVTGAIALLKAAFPSASSDELEARVLNTVDTQPGWDGRLAYAGRLNLAAAMTTYPGRPTITAPKSGGFLHAAESSTLRWRTAAGASSDATFSAEIGLPYSVWDADFEGGTLTGFSAGPESSADWAATDATPSVRTGTYAARSGDPGPATDHGDDGEYSVSSMQTTVTVPAEGATLSFWWKQDGTEDLSQGGAFAVDGNPSNAIWSGEDWTQSTVELTAGEHELSWSFFNYDTTAVGSGATCVDDVRLDSHSYAALGSAGAGATNMGFSVPSTSTADAWVRLRSNLNGVHSAWAYAKGVHISTDTVAPASPTALTATPDTDGSISIAWTNPADGDFSATRILWSADTTPTGPEDEDATVAFEGTETATVIGPLTSGVRAHISAYACDNSGNWSSAVSTSAVVVDSSPPTPVAFLTGRHRDGAVTLGWTPPLASTYSTVTVLARTDTTPTAGDPSATVIFAGRGASAIDTTEYSTAVTRVFYSVYATDLTGNVSAVRSIRVAMDTNPPVGWISIADDEQFTPSSIVPVHSYVTGATEMRFFINDEFDPEALWQPFSADTIVTLLPIHGPQSVVAEFRDAEGNVMRTGASIYVDILPPSAPTHLSAAASGIGVMLGWDPPSDPAVVAYRVDRAPSPAGPWQTITPPWGAESYDGTLYVDGLTPGRSYSFRVYAIDGVGQVSPSAGPVAVTTHVVRLTKPSAPSRAKKNRRFKVATIMTPAMAIGSAPAQFQCYRLVGKHWKLRKTVAARAVANAGAGVKCSANVSLPTGRWRLRARQPDTGVTSGWRSVRVR